MDEKNVKKLYCPNKECDVDKKEKGKNKDENVKFKEFISGKSNLSENDNIKYNEFISGQGNISLNPSSIEFNDKEYRQMPLSSLKNYTNNEIKSPKPPFEPSDNQRDTFHFQNFDSANYLKKEEEQTYQEPKISSKNVFVIKSEEQQAWKFIYNYINNDSKQLLQLKNNYGNNNEFYKYLSDLLIEKLSTKTDLLKNLHRNTLKALPKVITAIFLLSFQNIEPITGDDLEKISEMTGQYKKLRAIANSLNLNLPFIMGDEVKRILDEKKSDIFNGVFFPSLENLYNIDNRLIPSKKMVKTISRWIRKHSNYNGLTELKEIVFEHKSPKPKENNARLVILDEDKFKNSIILRNICDTIIAENSELKSYKDISRIIDMNINTLMRTDHRRHLKYSSFLKLQELYKRPIVHQTFAKALKKDKWIDFWQDSEGNLLSDSQAKKKMGEYLKKEILKNDTCRYDWDYISNVLKRNDFLSYLKERGFKYNEILEAVGLKPNLIQNRWEFFNWDPSGIPRSYDEAFNNAVEYLKDLILKHNYNFQLMDKPSQEFLTEKHEDFMGALKRYSFNFYDVLKEAGFQNDRFRKKWKILDADEKGILYTKQELERKIYQFFNEKILPIYEEKQLINDKMGPSYDEAVEALNNTIYNGFISACNARGISLGMLLFSVGLSPRISLNQKIGTAFHWIAEYNFMMHTRIDNGCISYYESRIHDDDEITPDNTIEVDNQFRNLPKKAKIIPKQITRVNVDYYLIHSSKNSYKTKKDKTIKGYQDENSLLILVPLNIKSNILIPKKNVLILSPMNFCDFFGFSEERKKYFINFARLALQAINKSNKEALEKLLQEAERCKKELTSNPKFNFKSK